MDACALYNFTIVIIITSSLLCTKNLIEEEKFKTTLKIYVTVTESASRRAVVCVIQFQKTHPLTLVSHIIANE